LADFIFTVVFSHAQYHKHFKNHSEGRMSSVDGTTIIFPMKMGNSSLDFALFFYCPMLCCPIIEKLSVCELVREVIMSKQ
jgi:hypothetical protein